MSDHKATIHWDLKAGEDFVKGKYSREHTWQFDGGFRVPGSSSPSVVPLPWSNPTHVDPEEALVAAASSCHMLSYLYVAYLKGFVVKSYHDEAVGHMTKNEKGVPWISLITLDPKIVYGEKAPNAAEEEQLHHAAHEQCFIAQSIKSEIVIAGAQRKNEAASH